jgi:hypothetical protein
MPTNKNVRNSTIEKMPTIMSKSTIKMPTYHPKMPKKMSENLQLKRCLHISKNAYNNVWNYNSSLEIN